jgi:hypothetical protein
MQHCETVADVVTVRMNCGTAPVDEATFVTVTCKLQVAADGRDRVRHPVTFEMNAGIPAFGSGARF